MTVFKSFNFDKNFRRFFVVFIVAVYLYTIFFTYIHNQNSEGYILGDWLINYQDGGFKRRGLSGSLFFLLQDVSGLSLQMLVFSFQFLLISFFFFILYQILKKKEITLLYASLLLSPLGFVGLLDNVDYVGKKEFLLFAIFAYFILLIYKKKLTITKEYILVGAIVTAMLFHEIILFFIPYFIIAKFYSDGKKLLWKSYVKYIGAAVLPAAMIILFGKNINEGNSLPILQERGVVLTKGIFFWNIDEKAILIDRIQRFWIYGLGFLLAYLHIAYYIIKSRAHYPQLLWFLIAAFIYSIPLFYVGLDWGRWLYIHMIMIIILTALFLKDIPHKTFFSTNVRFVTVFIILLSMVYRIDLSGLFTFEGLFYRIFLAPAELLNKML